MKGSAEAIKILGVRILRVMAQVLVDCARLSEAQDVESIAVICDGDGDIRRIIFAGRETYRLRKMDRRDF
jgi:hypothetical protein